MYSIRRTKTEMVDTLKREGVELVNATMVGHSTLEYYRPNGNRVIRFHCTDVVEIDPNGSVGLNSDGHRTVTTKRRFNEYLPGRASVYQHKHEWYLTDTDGATVEYYDGITVDASGRLPAHNCPQPAANLTRTDSEW